MDILITGAGGLVGSHLVKELSGVDNSIYCIDKRVPPEGENIISITGDILHWDKWADQIKDTVSIIIHLAAQVNVSNSWENPAYDLLNNGVGTAKMLELAKYVGAKYIIYTSSAAVYGRNSRPVTEKDAIHPTCPYGLSKKVGEEYLNFFKLEMGIKCLTLRISNIFGEGSRGVISIFKENAEVNQPITLFGSGKQVRDYIHISDVARAIIMCMDERLEGTYNLSSGVGRSLIEIMELFRKRYKKLRVDTMPAQKGEIYFSVLKNEKLKAKIPWEPKVKLEDYILKG